MATHTPTPWNANESVFSANGMTEIHIGTPAMTACVVYVDKAASHKSEQESNAQFIVRACNSHAQLVAALEMLTKALYDSGNHDLVCLAREYIVARAALTATQS